MRNVQVIDGADNCTFPIFQVTDDEFRQIFPGEGQDIELAEDFIARVGNEAASRLLEPIWSRPIAKSKINGLHGTLLFGFTSRRAHFPATRRERDWNFRSLNSAQRDMRRSEIE